MEYTFSTSDLPSERELVSLFGQTSWAADRDEVTIRSMLEASSVVVSVRCDTELIGFGRAISDGVYRALLDDIIIDSKHRGKGLGKAVVELLLDQLNEVEEIFLNAGSDKEPFYRICGFSEHEGITMKKRNTKG